MTDKRVTFYDKCFKDKQGKIALTEQANAPIIVAVISAIPALLVSGNIFGTIAALVSFGAFFTWSWLEIFDGVNYFRRVLGVVVMIVTFAVALMRIYVW